MGGIARAATDPGGLLYSTAPAAAYPICAVVLRARANVNLSLCIPGRPGFANDVIPGASAPSRASPARAASGPHVRVLSTAAPNFAQPAERSTSQTLPYLWPWMAGVDGAGLSPQIVRRFGRPLGRLSNPDPVQRSHGLGTYPLI